MKILIILLLILNIFLLSVELFVPAETAKKWGASSGTWVRTKIFKLPPVEEE